LLLGILAFEWRYAARRLTFAAAAAGFGVMGFVLAATGFASQGIHVNSPYAIATSAGLLALLSVFASTVLCAPSLLRDEEHQMAELVGATSATRAQLVLGRFAGSFLAVETAFACGLAGMVAGTLLARHDPSRVAPFGPSAYLWSCAALALPAMLFAAALLFAIAAWTRSTLATYVGGATLYVLYFAAALAAGSPLMAGTTPASPQTMAIAALADPFGLSAFFEATHRWTAAERDVRSVPLAGRFLVNRLLWTAVSGLLLWTATRARTRTVKAAARPTPEETVTAGHAVYAPVRVAPNPFRAFLSAARLELRALLTSWPFLALAALVAGFLGIELAQTFGGAELGTALVPATSLVVNELAQPLSFLALLALVYLGAELVFRERAVRIAEVVDATPAPNGAFFAAKAAGLAAVIGLLTLVACAAGVLLQLASGHRALELGLYASLLLFVGLPLVLVSVLQLLLLAVSPNRHVGLLLSLVAALVLHLGLGGFKHPLLRYASAPEVPVSDIAGFSPAASSFAWQQAYWACGAALLALLAIALWPRGTSRRWRSRLRALPLGWAAALGLAFLATGGMVFVRTNVWNRYETPQARKDWRAGYERNYRRLAGEPVPSIVHIAASLDLHPEERRAALRGAYTLENRAGAPIGELLVTLKRGVTRASLALDGKAPASADARFGTSTFRLSPPLAAGARAELRFEVDTRRRGGGPNDVLANGSFLLGLPITLGYRAGYELDDPLERRKRGLPPPTQQGPLEASSEAAVSSRGADKATFDLTVATPESQIAVGPVGLRETSVVDGRRLYRYRSEQPVVAYLGVSSARYAIKRLRHRAVDIEVLYHPAHARNVDRMLEAAARTLDYCVAQFGPYPHPQLRIAEVPSFAMGGAAFALPGVIFFREDRGFLTDAGAPGRIDLVSKRVAHEVAHQWWGHQVAPSPQPGASALVETLARYTELRVLKALYGAEALTPVLAVEHDRYLEGRTGGDEVPLARVGDQAYLYYAKGSVVMAALADLIGEDEVNRALRELLKPGAPTAAQLVEELRRVTPAEHHPLLDEWWNQMVIYELAVASARATRLPEGRTRVEATIVARKNNGAPLREPLDVAVYDERGKLLASARPLVVSASTAVSFLVDGTPDHVAVDPFVHRLDLDRADNVRDLEK